jgi:hypothetical protein
MKPSNGLLFVALAIGSVVSANAASPLDKYPSLDKKQLGALRHMIELSRRPPGSWQFMEPENRLSNDSVQFQIAYMSYALAVVQSQVTPAYRELYRQALRSYILKILQRDVWDMWLQVIEIPEFKKHLDPSKDWRDPVREKNIMYSGHILQMIGLYETLYDDREFDAPGAIVFELPRENGSTHTYNHESLAKLIADQFVSSGHIGIECEPNRIFTECNQHAILGLIQYDRLHGTNLSDVRHRFWEKAKDLRYIDPETNRTMWCYLVAEKERIIQPLAWSDGWTGIMMHGWNRGFVESVYPAQRDAELAGLIDTTPERWRVRWGTSQVSYDFGFLAAYAAEMGDRTTAQKLLKYADEHFTPRWVDGRYFYPRRTVVGEEFEGPPKSVPTDKLGQHQVGPLTGNALLGFARLNPGQGIWNLYNKTTATSFAHSSDPEVADVRYPEVQIIQAYYDKAARRLAVSMVPGTDDQGRISFAVRNLSPTNRYVVTMDGAEKVLLDKGTVRALGPHTFDAAWNASSRMLKLDCTLSNGRTVVVEEQ